MFVTTLLACMALLAAAAGTNDSDVPPPPKATVADHQVPAGVLPAKPKAADPVPTPTPAPTPIPAPTPPPSPAPTPEPSDPLVSLLLASQTADAALKKAQAITDDAAAALAKTQDGLKTAQTASEEAWLAFMGEVSRRHRPTPVLTKITVSPTKVALATGSVQIFAAAAYDQTGVKMDKQPAFKWTTSVGTINSNGMLTARASACEGDVTATSGNISGTATVNVTAPVDPNPPAPQPPTPQPGTTSNLRVLVCYNPMADIQEAQWVIFTSPKLRTWLDAHCPNEDGQIRKCNGNGTCTMQTVTKHSYRIIPSSNDPTGDTAIWLPLERDIIQHGNFPWIRAWDTKGELVIDQSLPSSVADTLTLLKKYGGD